MPEIQSINNRLMLKRYTIILVPTLMLVVFQLKLTALGSETNTIQHKYNEGLELYNYREYEKAIECFLQVIEFDKKNTDVFEYDIESVYFKLGLCYQRTENYDMAISCFNKVLDISNEDMFCKTYINLGIIYSLQSDHAKAVKYYKQAEYYLDHTSNKALGYLIFHNLGIVYSKEKEFQKAIDSYKKSLDIAIKFNIPITNIYMNIALAYEKQNDIQNAHKFFNLAVGEYQKNSNQNNVDLAWIQMNYGNFCAKTGDLKEGIRLLNNALNLFITSLGKKHSTTAYTYYLLGDIEQSNNVKSSLDYYQKALISKVPGFNSKNIYDNPEISDILPDNDILLFLKQKSAALIKLSHTENKLQNITTALSTLELTTQLIENLHKGFQLEQSRLELIGNEKSTYSDLVSVSLGLYELTNNEFYKHKAFQYTEKTKYATLKAQMKDEELAGISGIPDSLSINEKDIRLSINQYRSKLKEEKQKDSLDNTAVERLERELFGLYEKQDRLVSYFEENFPKYHQLKYDNEFIDIKEIQNKLSRKDAVIEYFIADTSLVIFVLTKNSLDVVQQGIDSSFIKAYTNVVNELLREDISTTSKDEFYEYIENAYGVYQTIFLPIEPYIKGKNLVVVPDQSLSFLPLGVLVSDNPDLLHWGYKELPFLIKEYAISYVYSSSLISRKRRLSWKNNFAAFTPSYTIDKYRLTTNKEVEAISKHIKTDLYIDSTATELNFIRSLENYDIVHLNMHTDSDAENNNISLLFTETSDSLNDGKLNYIDIYNLESKTKLISLGACMTGYGEIIQGEGVISLARSFHYAGCETSITSLWLLKDYSSKVIMPVFYKKLSDGQRLDNALRKAKLKYIEDKFGIVNHPGFWGGIVCIGNTNPVTYQKKAILLASGILLIIGVFVYFKTRK